MALGNNYQQSDAGPSEFWPPLSDPQITPHHSFSILTSQGQVENIEDIFHLLSNVELHLPYTPPAQPFPSPNPPPKTSDQISHSQSEAQKKTTQDNFRRKRPSEAYNLMERRRRTKIQEKLNTLQQLLPNCNKTDRVSILSGVIEHIKSLQNQVEVMNTLGIPVMPPYLSGGGGGQQTMQMPYFPPPPRRLAPMAPVTAMGVYPSYSTAFTVSPATFLPFHMYPAATSLTTTRAHDVGCATTMSTTTTTDNMQQMLHIFQGGQMQGSMATVRPSEIVKPSFRGNNPCSWVMDDD